MSVKFDGRSFEYRRPTMSRSSFGRGGERMSRHAYGWLNPVYAYSEGRVTDAAIQLGITNVNKPEEVERILSEIRTGPATRLAQQQQAYQQQLQDTANQTQADIAKQLQIVQNDKTAVSKMMNEYSKQLADEADRKKKANEAARIAAATSAANQSRSGQTASLQIQPASSTPKTAGTQTFKKRSIASNRKQQLTSGINLGTSSLLNI